MSKVFISYHRRSQAVAESLVADLEAMGHTVWFDQELAGGQAWWNQILAMIRDADVFLLVLDRESMTSTACQREYRYAADLGRPVIPVLTGEGVSINLLPPALSQIQIVDYRNRDREGLLRLTRSLTMLPPTGPLPDPLPAAPAVPLSYLGTLTELVDQAAPLSFESQSSLIVDLRAKARDPETDADVLALLRRLRKRRDLYASIGNEIDELLRAGEPEAPTGRPTPDPAAPASLSVPSLPADVESVLGTLVAAVDGVSPTVRHVTGPARLIVAGIGGVVGMIVSATAILVFGPVTIRRVTPELLVFGVGFAPWAVAGAIAGRNMLAVKIALVLSVVFVFLAWVALVGERDRGLAAVVFGAPLGLLIGAIAGAILGRTRTKAVSSSVRV